MQPTCSCRTAGVRTPALDLLLRVTSTGTGLFVIAAVSANRGGALAELELLLMQLCELRKSGTDSWLSQQIQVIQEACLLETVIYSMLC